MERGNSSDQGLLLSFSIPTLSSWLEFQRYLFTRWGVDVTNITLSNRELGLPYHATDWSDSWSIVRIYCSRIETTECNDYYFYLVFAFGIRRMKSGGWSRAVCSGKTILVNSITLHFNFQRQRLFVSLLLKSYLMQTICRCINIKSFLDTSLKRKRRLKTLRKKRFFPENAFSFNTDLKAINGMVCP